MSWPTRARPGMRPSYLPARAKPKTASLPIWPSARRRGRSRSARYGVRTACPNTTSFCASSRRAPIVLRAWRACFRVWEHAMSRVHRMTTANDVKQELTGFLVRTGLAAHGEDSQWTPLTGGVSSDIWRVDLPGRSLCVKRALSRLKVAAEWRAPVSRNIYEWRWLCFAHQTLPESVPRPLAHDEEAGALAMEFLEPEA